MVQITGNSILYTNSHNPYDTAIVWKAALGHYSRMHPQGIAPPDTANYAAPLVKFRQRTLLSHFISKGGQGWHWIKGGIEISQLNRRA
jgi:hypothetical protein